MWCGLDCGAPVDAQGTVGVLEPGCWGRGAGGGRSWPSTAPPAELCMGMVLACGSRPDPGQMWCLRSVLGRCGCLGPAQQPGRLPVGLTANIALDCFIWVLGKPPPGVGEYRKPERSVLKPFRLETGVSGSEHRPPLDGRYVYRDLGCPLSSFSFSECCPASGRF